jgi:hypothetical protein
LGDFNIQNNIDFILDEQEDSNLWVSKNEVY